MISYVHLGFMLHLLLFNESVLHYLSIMCVIMMVFSVCVNDSVQLQYINIYFTFYILVYTSPLYISIYFTFVY